MTIPYGRQKITAEDISAVVDVLKSDFLTQGPTVPRFEAAIAKSCAVEFAVAANSGTSALHLSCLALGVGRGDVVWTSAITFVASANCAAYCGAELDFVDIDPDNYNLCTVALEEKLIQAKKDGRLPKVVIPVHMAGQSCDMRRIFELSKEFGFSIIEDASHALGATYGEHKVGSCKYSDVTTFSFHPVKLITTGEGGMAVTNDKTLFAKMERLRSHGVTRDPQEMLSAYEGPWFYEQLDLGFNYRMTDIEAALGLSQLSKLEDFVESRRNLAANYDNLLDGSAVRAPRRDKYGMSACHLYIVMVESADLGASQKQLFERLHAEGIMANLHYIPVYRHPYYRFRGHADTRLPMAETYYSKAISLPIYPGLRSDEQEYIINTLLSPIGHQNIF